MNSGKTQSILIGGGVAAALSILFSVLMTSMLSSGGQIMQSAMGLLVCCLVPVVGSFLAVWHYTSTNKLTIKSGEGAGMGALALIFASVVSGLVNMLFMTMGVVPNQEQQLAMQRENMLNQGMSPEQIDQALGFAQSLSNPILGLVIGIVISAIVGAIFGAIAAALFKSGEKSEVAA